MKTKLILLLVLTLATIHTSIAFQEKQDHKVLFEQAKYTMETKADLKEAINLFESLIKTYPNEKEYVAKALLYQGMCYEKLGNHEAIKKYQRLVNNFPGQKSEVAMAKKRLSRLMILAEKVSNAPVVPKFTKIEIASNPQNGVLSPDGKMLAFTSGDGVWIVPLHGNVKSNIAGEPKLLANVPGAWNNRNVLAWSGDGKWIAVNGVENGEDCAYILSISGGEPCKIQLPARSGTFNYRLSLSPDGQTLAFSAINPRVKIDKTDIHIRFLYVVSTKNGEPKQISKGSGTYPAFSPDGKHIAYISYEMRSGLKNNYTYISKLWIVESSGENPQMLASSDGFLSGPIWSPDGRFIATGKADEIFIYPLSPDLSKIEEPAIIKSNNSGFGILAGWTPNNEIGVFQWSKEHIAIYSVLASGGKAVQVIPEELWPYYPRWSPDGKHIFFRSVKQNHVIMVYVPAKGGNPVEVPVQSVRKLMSKVPGGGHNISPDGKKIVISAYQEPVDPKEGPDIWVINLDGSNPLRLTHDGLVEGYPCWSPDGQWIAFKDRHAKHEGEGYEAIYIVAATGGEIKQVTAETDIVGNGAIAFSPDGTNITFFSDGKIKNIPLEGGQQKVVVGNVKFGRHSHMAYSPDGLKIAYNIDGKIWIRKIDDGGTEELETGLSPNVQISEFSWSPNGEKIAFVASSGGELEFYLVENFLPLDKLAQKSEKEDKEFNIRRVSPDTKLDFLGAFGFLGSPSPDGKYLSYTDAETGNLATYKIATGEKQSLTNEGSINPASAKFAYYSRWSPDGKQIVYDWFNKGIIELRIIGLDGSKPQILYRNEDVVWAQACDWSADGTKILAAFEKEGRIQIAMVSTVDGSVRILKTLEKEWPKKFEFSMNFSPDGNYIVYDFPQKTGSPERDIFLLSTNGEPEVTLIEHPADDHLLGWAPNGKRILFASDRRGSLDAWSIHISDGKPQGTPELVKSDIGQRFQSFGFTQEGSFYYGNEGGQNRDIYTAKLNPETGIMIAPPKSPITRFKGNNWIPDYSPDGKYLAYVTGKRFLPRNLLIIHNLETGEEKTLSTNIHKIQKHRWSPDCSSILFRGEDEKYNAGIYQIDIQTGTVTTLVPKYSDSRSLQVIQWSGDGKSFYMTRGFKSTKTLQIVIREIESGTEKELYRAFYPKNPNHILYSPDGKWLSLIEGKELKIMPVEGGESRVLYKCKQEGENLGEFRWSPDGKYIFSVLDQPKQNKISIWRIPIEGGEIQKVLEMSKSSHENIRQLSLHPDGQHIAFQSTSPFGNTEVWVMENFLPKEETEKQ